MSIFAQVFAELNVESVRTQVNDISPYVRARGTDFPAITFMVGTEEFERNSTGFVYSLADVQVTCMARSVVESEAIAASVKNAVTAGNCNFLTSIERDYEEGYDDDSVGVFSVTLNYSKQTGI